MTPGGITGRMQGQRSNQVVPQSMHQPGSSSGLSAGSNQMPEARSRCRLSEGDASERLNIHARLREVGVREARERERAQAAEARLKEVETEWQARLTRVEMEQSHLRGLGLGTLSNGELEKLENKMEESLVRLRAEVGERRQAERCCQICMDDAAAKDTALIPCGHLMCAACAERVQDQCPFCSERPAKRMRVY